MRLSVVNRRSKPSASAAFSRSPFFRRSRLVLAVCRDQRECASTSLEDCGGTVSRRLRATKSRTAVICSRLTSNCVMTSSILRSSRFSITVATGRRVSWNTQAPPTLPGILSTAEHRDQSRLATVAPSFRSAQIGQALEDIYIIEPKGRSVVCGILYTPAG